MSYILKIRQIPTKKIRFALTTIFGIGLNKANQVCDRLGISDSCQIKELKKNQLDFLVKILSNAHLVDSELRRIIQNDVKRLISIGCYRGFRHSAGLPLRGQRTHTNAKTTRRLRKMPFAAKLNYI